VPLPLLCVHVVSPPFVCVSLCLINGARDVNHSSITAVP
jgi:hypothetical protein